MIEFMIIKIKIKIVTKIEISRNKDSWHVDVLIIINKYTLVKDC
mgnify:CR=1 FL=1